MKRPAFESTPFIAAAIVLCLLTSVLARAETPPRWTSPTVASVPRYITNNVTTNLTLVDPLPMKETFPGQGVGIFVSGRGNATNAANLTLTFRGSIDNSRSTLPTLYGTWTVTVPFDSTNVFTFQTNIVFSSMPVVRLTQVATPSTQAVTNLLISLVSPAY